jgi:hypothetical protein
MTGLGVFIPPVVAVPARSTRIVTTTVNEPLVYDDMFAMASHASRMLINADSTTDCIGVQLLHMRREDSYSGLETFPDQFDPRFVYQLFLPLSHIQSIRAIQPMPKVIALTTQYANVPLSALFYVASYMEYMGVEWLVFHHRHVAHAEGVITPCDVERLRFIRSRLYRTYVDHPPRIPPPAYSQPQQPLV